jgi:hypothetical protein
VLRLIVIALVVSACSRDHGTPHVRQPQKRDEVPPLRGGAAPKSERIASYKIDARLDVTKHQVSATQTLRWKNTGASAVDQNMPHHHRCERDEVRAVPPRHLLLLEQLQIRFVNEPCRRERVAGSTRRQLAPSDGP